MALVAAESDHASPAVASEDRDVVAHDDEVARPWAGDAMAKGQRVDGAAGRVGEPVAGLARNGVDEVATPGAAMMRDTAMSDIAARHGEKRVEFEGAPGLIGVEARRAGRTQR